MAAIQSDGTYVFQHQGNRDEFDDAAEPYSIALAQLPISEGAGSGKRSNGASAQESISTDRMKAEMHDALSARSPTFAKNTLMSHQFGCAARPTRHFRYPAWYPVCYPPR